MRNQIIYVININDENDHNNHIDTYEYDDNDDNFDHFLYELSSFHFLFIKIPSFHSPFVTLFC